MTYCSDRQGAFICPQVGSSIPRSADMYHFLQSTPKRDKHTLKPSNIRDDKCIIFVYFPHPSLYFLNVAAANKLRTFSIWVTFFNPPAYVICRKVMFSVAPESVHFSVFLYSHFCYSLRSGRLAVDCNTFLLI